MEETALVDDETEDVSFLPGDSSFSRRSAYEPSFTIPKLKCTQNKIIFSVIFAFVVCIITIAALINALVHGHAKEQCPLASSEIHQLTTTSPAKEATTPEISTTKNPFPWNDIRLPRHLVPETYHIFMNPNLTGSWYQGSVEIRLRVLTSTNFIIFHTRDLNITDQTVKYADNSENSEITVVETLESRKLEQFYLRLDKNLPKNASVILTVMFHAPLKSKLTGFYKSTYQTKANETRVIATTDFEPTDARSAFPCFDEPDLKANFTLSMVRDKHHISLFNMPLVETVPYKRSELLVEDRFQESVKMSTYLVAFVVCDFANLTALTASNTTVRVFAQEDIISDAEFALQVATEVLPFYETFFGIKFPLPKLDLIAIPDFNSGAMENWGLTTYRTTSILFDAEESDFSAQRSVASTVAHELAHQWFGNLVTMKWWDDLWLNEGFASYVEYLGADSVKPEWNIQDLFLTEDFRWALNMDCLNTSHPIQVPVQNPNQINEIFDSISYDKGGSILRMLQNFLGMETFKKGLQRYLSKYSFSNTETVDLWNSLTEVSTDKGLDVKKIMDTWTQQMGYPVVTLTRKGNEIEATQERFLINPKETTHPEESPFRYKWYIPLNYITSRKPNTTTYAWMNMSNASFTIPADTKWIKANFQTYGLYRVNYDPVMWNDLIAVLNTNHKVLSSNDRAGLLSDAFSLASAGRIEVTFALDMSTYLVKEMDYAPWSIALNKLAYIKHRLLDRPVHAKFKKYLLTIISPVVEKFGWKDTGSRLDRYLRELILSTAVALGHDKTVTEGKGRFDDWMNNNTRLQANLKSVIYKAGIQKGGEKEWDFCWQKFQETNIASEQKLFLEILGDSRDLQILKRYLQYSLDPSKIRSQDCGDVIEGVARNSYGRDLAWRFLRQNWDKVRQRIGNGAFTTTSIIKTTASTFSTQFDYDQASLVSKSSYGPSFYKTVSDMKAIELPSDITEIIKGEGKVSEFYKDRDVGSGKRAVLQSLENIRMNMDWLQAHEKPVTDWLHQH